MPLKNGKQYDVEDIKSLAALKGKNVSIQDAKKHKSLEAVALLIYSTEIIKFQNDYRFFV